MVVVGGVVVVVVGGVVVVVLGGREVVDGAVEAVLDVTESVVVVGSVVSAGLQATPARSTTRKVFRIWATR